MLISLYNTLFIFIFSISLVHITPNDENLFNSLIEVDSNSLDDNNKIKGKMNINGINYNAICDCNPSTQTQTTQSEEGPKCDPSKLTIHSEKGGQGASQDDIRNLIGNIDELDYVKVPSTSFKCLDGRSDNAVVATPGGDTGEFILALMVYEDLLEGGKKLTQQNVDVILTQYLNMMPHARFYMCTDDKAIAHIEKDLSVMFNLI